MDSKNQFTVFCLCIGVGFFGGLLYELFAIPRLFLKEEKKWGRILGMVLDIQYFISFAAFCVSMAYWLRFPDFRTYMWLGYLGGGIIYSKTLRRILAFLEKVCYNNLTKGIATLKTRKKTLQKQGVKDYDTR